MEIHPEFALDFGGIFCCLQFSKAFENGTIRMKTSHGARRFDQYFVNSLEQSLIVFALIQHRCPLPAFLQRPCKLFGRETDPTFRLRRELGVNVLLR